VADNFGPGGVYANIPRLDSHGRPQIPMFMRWNPDPVGNDASNLSQLNPNLQKVVAQARADNPNLNFVIGNGKRSAADQDQAKAWGWSKVGSQDGGDANVHMQGNAVDLWGLDSNGRVQFNPSQQQQISQAMKDAASKVGVGVNWGGDWKSFKDAPHFELAGGGSAAASGAPEGPTSTSAAPASSRSSSPAPSGTTLNSSPAQGPIFETLRNNIAQFESGNNYSSLGPVLRNGDQAVGKYQVMGSNVPSWTQKWLGKSMTPAEFRANPQAQEAVFQGEFGSYLQGHSPADAASMWFTGKPLAQGANLKDVLGTSGGKYAEIATKGIDNPNAVPGTTINSSGAPAAAPGAPPAVAATPPASGGLAGSLPGFQAGSPGAKMTASGLQQLAGGKPGGGPTDEPPPMPLQQAQPPQPMGGAMMMRPGGQNMEPRMAAMQALAQQGFMTQPSVAAFGGGGLQSPLPSTAQSTIMPMAPGGATGMPMTGIAGTTLNSPSQLQMALMTGALSPYDMYARQAGS